MVQISKQGEDRVLELHEKIPFVQASDTTALTPHAGFSEAVNIQEYIEKLKTGRINIISLSFVTWAYDNFTQATKSIYQLYKLLDKHKDALSLITSYNDVKNVIDEGRIGVIMHFHNTSMADDDVGLLSILHRLGLRIMQLTYQGRNLVGDGCGEKSNCGLSSFGYKFVEEMNRLRILIDLAHAGKKTFMDALDFSKDPVIYSHGCVEALSKLPPGRHLSDEQIKALAEKDGVLGMMAKHLNPPIGPSGEFQAMTMDDYMKHLEYVVDLVGVDHVGIGTENGEGRSLGDSKNLAREFTARYYKPEETGLYAKAYVDANLKGTLSVADHKKRYSAAGTETVVTLKKNLLRELVARGYSDKEIAKILSGNFLRIYRKIW